MGTVFFGSSSHHRSYSPSDFFPVFSPASNLTAFPFEFLQANQSPRPVCCRYISIFNPNICCFPDQDLENSSIPIPIRLSPTIIPLSLSLSVSLSLSYCHGYLSNICLSFSTILRPTSKSKQLMTKTITQHPSLYHIIIINIIIRDTVITLPKILIVIFSYIHINKFTKSSTPPAINL